MSLEMVTDSIWSMKTPLKPMGLELGTKTTVVRTPDGLWVHSPGRLDGELRRALQAIAPVRFIVAPSRVHHMFVKPWAEAFPDARVFGAPGLKKKRKDVDFHSTLTEDTVEWGDTIDLELYAGAPFMNEVVFLHRPTASLMLTDLAFNIRSPVGWWTRSYLKMSNADGKFGQSWLIKASTRDRALAKESVERMLSWEFDRIIVTHGEVLERGAKDAIRSAFSWLL